MSNDTPHKSFEERVDEVLEQYSNYLHDGWSGNKPTTPTINRKEARTALLAAHKEEVERIKDEINIYLVKEGLRHGTEILKDIRTRANLTDDHEGLSDRVGW